MRTGFLVTFSTACIIGGVQATKIKQDDLWWMTDASASGTTSDATTTDLSADDWWLASPTEETQATSLDD